MGSTNQRIESFLNQVRRRLNLRRLASSAVWALLATSLVTLTVALVYVLQGYAVDRRWYVAAAVAAVAATIVAWLSRLAGSEGAARFADRFYGLKDALISSVHFARDGKHDGFCELTQEKTAQTVDSLDSNQIDWRPAARPAWTAIIVAAVAILLAFKSPSMAVVERLEREDLTLATSKLRFQELKDLANKLNQQTNDPLERALLEPDKLKEKVDALEATKDLKEALRQQAKLEKEINKQLTKLQQKKDEELAEEIAKELEKARETKALAKDLKNKKFKKAAEQLEELKPEKAKELSEKQKELAKLRAAAKRMAAAVRNKRGNNTPGKTGKSNKPGQSPKASSSAQSGKKGKASGANGSGGGELADAVQGLEHALSQLSESLDEAAQQQKVKGKFDGKLSDKIDAQELEAMMKLADLEEYLKMMQMKMQAAMKLAMLSEACTECQNGLCMNPGAKPGNGLKAGWGSSFAKRDQRDELKDNGMTTGLKGVKGVGPSQTSVETADEGTGVSTIKSTAKQRSFERQVESFVNREDVPEEVRAGVKQYFQDIHAAEETP